MHLSYHSTLNHIAYITLNPISTFLCQFYPGFLENIAGNSIIFFFIAAITIRWFGQIVGLERRTWLLLLPRYFFIDSSTLWYLLSPSSYLQLFGPFLVFKKCERLVHRDIVGFLLPVISSKFLRDSMGNSNWKKKTTIKMK